MGDPPAGGHESERLSALLDDELSEEEALAVTRHLAVCDRCLQEVVEIRAARQALRSMPRLDPPPGLLGAAARAGERLRRRRGSRVRTAAVLVGLLLSVLAGATASGAGGGGAPSPDRYVAERGTRPGAGSLTVPAGPVSPSP